MILILSSLTDQTTNEVIRWLDHYGKHWERLDFTKPVKLQAMEVSSTVIPYFILKREDGSKIDSRKITAYWYRRGDLNFDYDLDLKELEDLQLRNSLSRHIRSELNFLKTGIHAILATLPSVNDYRTAELNKFEVLLTARKVGLKIPDTFVTDQRNMVTAFGVNHREVISKAIQRGHRFQITEAKDTYDYLCYTEQITPDELSDTFFPSLFQEKLEKQYELRVFFLCGRCYTMVIYSQADEQTSVDFRRYNMDKPNRNSPYELPKRIEQKIVALMISLELNSGSLDLIVTRNQEYVFLEVNSVGQFGMVSFPCHYDLYQKVAQKLIEPDEWMKN